MGTEFHSRLLQGMIKRRKRMNETMRPSIILDRLFWEIRRAFYSFRKSPALAIVLLQIPVIIFVYFKGAGSVYIDMAGILVFIILFSWFLVSVIHGNRKILMYSLMLLTIGTMLQCIFLKEAMQKYPEKYTQGTLASGLQLQYLLGFLAAIVISLIYLKWNGISSMKTCRLLFMVSVGISLLTIVFASSVGGVRNWIRVGGLSIQTTEIIKLIYIFLAAGLLGTVEVPSKRRIWAFYFVTATEALFLIIQSEYGTLLLLFFVFFAYLFLFVPETIVFLKTAAASSVFMACSVISGYQLNRLAIKYTWMTKNPVIKVFLKAYDKIANRFIYWMHPEKDPLGLGYQLIKAKESMVLGGWFGTASVTELPVKTSDLVYPALIQRCGMIFALLVFFIFIMLWLEGMRLFVRKSDRYHQAVAAGLVIMLFVQTIIIIAGSTGLCPLTGITLPFISSGGSSLLVSFMMVGILITVSGNVGWKGTKNEETEEFFKKSTAFAKLCAYSGYFNHAVPGPHLRAAARHFKESGRAKGKSKADDV